MVFGKSHHTIQLNIQNNSIEHTNTYKYLGTVIDPKLNFHKHIELLRNKATNRLNFLKITSTQKNNINPKNSLKIYRATIRNTMETGASYTLNSNKNKYKKMNSTINQEC